MEDDTRSVIIDIRKLRVCTKLSKDLFKPVRRNSVLKRTMEKRLRKPSDYSIHKYMLPCDKPLPVSHLKREEILLPYKSYSKKQLQGKHRQKLAISLQEKYKILSTDLKKRLYSEEPQDDVQALTDIDKGFFKYVSGRPLVDHVPLFKSLKASVAELLRIKQEIGSRHEAILNFEVNYKQEQVTYNLSLKRCKEQVKCFDSFISEDYRKSMAFLEEWDKLKSKLNLKLSELQNLAAEEFTIISRLMGLDYLYGLQQKYGRFLYYLSPPSWRAMNREFAKSVEIEAKGFDLGYTSEEDTFKVIFENMQKGCFGNLVKPVLYFTHPRDLLDIFDGIEKQQLHHYAYVTHLAPPKKMVKEGIKCLKDIINQETTLVASTITRFEKLLKFSNDRCTELKTKFFMILNGLFYESVGAPEVLKLFIHLEFCYEKVYVEKAINMDILTMAKALEEFYMDYSKRLDTIQSDTVKKAIVQYLDLEKRKMRKAKRAAQELRQFDLLERNLLRAHEPAATNMYRSFLPSINGTLPRRSVRRNYSKANFKIIERKPIDEAELEYLTLFTDWTEGDDPKNYLHKPDDVLN